MDCSSAVADNELRDNNGAGREIQCERSGAVRIHGIVTLFIALKLHWVWIGCVWTGEDKIHLREVAVSIEMGHSDTLALHCANGGGKEYLTG